MDCFSQEQSAAYFYASLKLCNGFVKCLIDTDSYLVMYSVHIFRTSILGQCHLDVIVSRTKTNLAAMFPSQPNIETSLQRDEHILEPKSITDHSLF